MISTDLTLDFFQVVRLVSLVLVQVTGLTLIIGKLTLNSAKLGCIPSKSLVSMMWSHFPRSVVTCYEESFGFLRFFGLSIVYFAIQDMQKTMCLLRLVAKPVR